MGRHFRDLDDLGKYLLSLEQGPANKALYRVLKSNPDLRDGRVAAIFDRASASFQIGFMYYMDLAEMLTNSMWDGIKKSLNRLDSLKKLQLMKPKPNAACNKDEQRVVMEFSALQERYLIEFGAAIVTNIINYPQFLRPVDEPQGMANQFCSNLKDLFQPKTWPDRWNRDRALAIVKELKYDVLPQFLEIAARIMNTTPQDVQDRIDQLVEQWAQPDYDDQNMGIDIVFPMDGKWLRPVAA